MSLCPQPLPPVPDDTARIARAAFRRGNPYVLLRDRLGAVFADADFTDLYPKRGQPAYVPWRLALVTLMQFREGLSDRSGSTCLPPAWRQWFISIPRQVLWHFRHSSTQDCISGDWCCMALISGRGIWKQRPFHLGKLSQLGAITPPGPRSLPR